MLTGDIRNHIDRIWDAFWSGGISNPLEVIEQITYLLFLRRLDDMQTLEELKAKRLKQPIERHWTHLATGTCIWRYIRCKQQAIFSISQSPP
jgi:hypothetical protein